MLAEADEFIDPEPEVPVDTEPEVPTDAEPDVVPAEAVPDAEPASVDPVEADEDTVASEPVVPVFISVLAVAPDDPLVPELADDPLVLWVGLQFANIKASGKTINTFFIAKYFY